MIQSTIYEAIARHELEERDRGMAQAAGHNGDILHLARGYAYKHVMAHGTVTIEDVRAALDHALGKGWPGGNWLGSVFKQKRWAPTGRWVQTSHKGGHRRAVREWRLR